MRKTLAFGMMAALAIGGAAWADHGVGYDPELDEVLFIGAVGPLAPGECMSFEFKLDNPNSVIGFSFEGNYVGQPPGGWASDLQLTITGPSGSTVVIGGFKSPSDLDWDFQGPDSAPLGFYASGPHFHAADGSPVFNSNGDGSTNQPGAFGSSTSERTAEAWTTYTRTGSRSCPSTMGFRPPARGILMTTQLSARPICSHCS